MGRLQDRLDQIVMETPMDELKDSILQACGYMERDGMRADGIRTAVKSVPEDTGPLRGALDACYEKAGDGALARIRPEYEKYAGHLKCIRSTVRDIEKKKRSIKDGPCKG